MFLGNERKVTKLILKNALLRGIIGVFAVATTMGCSRTTLLVEDGVIEASCVTNDDCNNGNLCESRQCIEGFCHLVAKVSCESKDACVTSRCESSTGACVTTPRTSDEDGDGHRAPLLGKRPGEAGACGDDCDDTRANAFPGGVETCDGADNDCNGIVDDHGSYGAPSAPVLVSISSMHEAIPASMTYASGDFAITTIQRDERWHGYFQKVKSDGSPAVSPVALTLESSDAMAGPIVWTGATFATAWEDRRDRSYDIYFNRLDPSGKKLGPDIRITNNDGFSVSPSLLWDGEGYLLAYSDQIDADMFQIFTRRLDALGNVVGELNPITDPFTDARGPRLLRTALGLTVVYQAINDGFFLQSLKPDLTKTGAPVKIPLTDPGEMSIRFSLDRFFVAWSEKTESVGRAIWAMTLDEQGNVIDEPRVLVEGRSVARSPTWVALGDRAYLVWADDYYHYGTYELSGQLFDSSLSKLGERTQLTNLYADTFDPTAVIGGGNLGIAFRSRALGTWQTYFLSLGCVN
jgi:Putative metal-binding motif